MLEERLLGPSRHSWLFFFLLEASGDSLLALLSLEIVWNQT